MVELRHFRYFLAAAEHGSFRKAAEAMGVNESAVSRRIRDLEDEIGASLFTRHHGGVELTLGGRRLLSRARKALVLISVGINDVAAIGRSESGRIKVGIFSSMASGFLRDLLSSFDENHTGVRIEVFDGDSDEHVSAIRQHRLDVAFLTGTKTWSGCDTAHLWSERVFAVLPSTHALSQKEMLE